MISAAEGGHSDQENAADETSRCTVRLRTCGSISFGVAVVVSRLWQDRDDENLDPRRGLRRRED